MIIVEGADLVGKTTLAKKLVTILNEEYDSPHIYRHLSRLPKIWRDCSARLGPRATPASLHEALASRWIVQDRFHMSEVMYASARQDEPMLTPIAYWLLEARLRARFGMMTILLIDATTDSEVITSRWREGEMYSLEQVKAVNKQYRTLAGSFSQTYEGYTMPFHTIVPVMEDLDYGAILGRFLDDYMNLQRELDASY
jgi:thymidylate kinase